LSARAACRLETLGFAEVYDYVLGKVDWLAHNLPVEGDRATPPTAGRLMRDDVVRCAPVDRVADTLDAVKRSPYTFALVTDETGHLLGRVRPSQCSEAHRERPVGEVMELDPSTVRPHRSAEMVAKRLAEKNFKWAIVTTPEGHLLGVAWREDLERAVAESTD
jgi:Mg/Co/Ni transporter MgtE